uniref:sterol regulatory element-binding protein cleavage-activating protein isoform X1 n=1 Tax=Ciona intestinalis TaxID=7719 RepID=UPI000EF5228D|nr:sterol regulatory element-binding protein cleavage-activating protein isoform X1 [Ciona intestinalis]|eukprot:XP_026695217.1 sterol regulatory element-binding protein cleavage-activating protein isoform X1 [Ciona intestinalis]
MYKSDSYRAPLAKVFDVLSEIQNFHIRNTNISVSWNCLQVSETVIKAKKRIKPLFPEYGCLLVSPASFWSNSWEKYKSDTNIIHTINKFDGKHIKTSQSIKELLFGISSKQNDIGKSDSVNQVVKFAVTLVLQKYHPRLIQELKRKMEQLYAAPVLPTACKKCSRGENPICRNLTEITTHVHFKPQMQFNDLIPLLSTYFFLGCYIYFSVRKINFVKSKIGMAFSAVVSVMASLMMAVGLCSLIGLTPTLNGGEMFPYLVCIIGLENILVITKSVVATPTHLDVDRRVALGLSREGCSITKNLLLEFVLIGIGYFSFIPEIQEFCAFALVGVLSDFLMNMMFFVTVLSIDTRRLDITEDIYTLTDDDLDNDEFNTYSERIKSEILFKRKQIKKKRRDLVHSVETGGKNATYLKIPKRLKVVFFFADTRMVQRGLMVSMVIWFVLLVYSDPVGIRKKAQSNLKYDDSVANKFDFFDSTLEVTSPSPAINTNGEINWSMKDLQSYEYLSFRHWPTLFAYYNITLAERFISILPPILIPVTISPDDAKLSRYPQQQSLTTTQDKHTDEQHGVIESNFIPAHFYTGRYQMTGLDYYLTLLLGAISGMFMVFILHIMYRCVCSRNYANWRKPRRNRQTVGSYISSVGDSMPIVLAGHSQLIECVRAEGTNVISSDISSELKVWDSHSGDCTCTIQRCLREYSLESQEISQSSIHKHQPMKETMVWCLTMCGAMIVTGCDDGSLEVWDSTSGELKCHHDAGKPGVVFMDSEGTRIVVARLSGTLDFFILDGSRMSRENQVQYRGTTNRHRNNSSELLMDHPNSNQLSLQLIYTVKSAHQQPISAFKMALGRVLTGSCDHTLKLFTTQDARFQSTMFGHIGPITVLYMDKASKLSVPAGAVSGSTDGCVRLWDLLTGLCLHKMEEHAGAITAVQCSTSHVLSTAQDNRLCIWSRRSGMLLQVTKLDIGCSSALCLLGESWCVTGGSGSLLLWDIRNGELLRRVELYYGSIVPPNVVQVFPISDLRIVCVLGHEMRIVRFPSVLEKID